MPFFTRKKPINDDKGIERTQPLSLYGQSLPDGHIAIMADENLAVVLLGELLTHTEQESVLVNREENASFVALGYSLENCELHAIDADFGHAQLRTLIKKVDGQKPLLVLGRRMGPLWPTTITLLQRLKGNTRVIADVSMQTTLPLPTVFRHFLVETGAEKMFDAAVERWHRHERKKPTYKKQWIGGGFSLYTRQ